MASHLRDVLAAMGKACTYTQRTSASVPDLPWQGDDEHGHVRAAVAASNRASSGAEVYKEAQT